MRTLGLRIFRIAFTMSLLVLLWQLTDGSAALDHLASAKPAWIAGAMLALTLQTALSAWRWRLTAARLDIALGAREALTEYYLAQAVNQALPGGVLGDAARAVRARAKAGLLASSQAVLFERMAGQLGLFLLLLAALAFALLAPGGVAWPAAFLRALPIVSLALCGALLLTALLAPRLPGLRSFVSLGNAFGHAVLARAVLGQQLALSLGTALCNVIAFACCAAAVGVELTPSAAFLVIPVILFTMVIPLTIAGWGLREGASVAFLPLAGASVSGSLAASVAFGFAFLAATLPGLALLLGRGSRPAGAPSTGDPR